MQAAQASHAAFQFALEHHDVCKKWHDESSYLILLTVPNEEELLAWADRVADAGVPHSVMVEPDLADDPGGWHTSMAVAPSEFNINFSSLPLLGKEVAMT